MAEKRTEKRKRRIRIDYRKAARALTLLVLVAVFLMNLFSAKAGAGEDYDRDLIRPCGNTEAEAPKLTAGSAAMYSIDLDKFVYEKNADEKLPPYSITKILTVYLALENLDPDQVLTASKNSVRELKDGMEMELEEGEKLKMMDLAIASMMMSANDAAIVLGEGVSGSEKAFVKLMNDTVKEWGCENTHFVNTNGWEHKNHYTTAHDMAIITKHCLENETLRKISVMERYVVPATNKNDELELDNALLKATRKIDGVIGGKTGSWSESQCTIAYGFKDNGLTSVVVLLDDTAKGRINDPVKMSAFAHEVTPGFIVTDSDKGVCEAWVKNGAVSKVSVDVKGLRYAYPKNNKARGVKVETEFGKVEAPLKQGDRIGKYRIYANDEQVGQGYLYAGEAVEKGWFLSRFYVSNTATLLAAVILALLAAFELARNPPQIPDIPAQAS